MSDEVVVGKHRHSRDCEDDHRKGRQHKCSLHRPAHSKGKDDDHAHEKDKYDRDDHSKGKVTSKGTVTVRR